MITAHPDGKGELVSDLAGPLPLHVICDMIGIPEEDEQKVFCWTNVILGASDPDVTADIEEFAKASMDFGAYSTAMAEDRRADPRDDLTASLVQAEVDGERLTSGEIASFFILLAVAGNETTRNAISHGVLAVTRYREQRDRYAWFDSRPWVKATYSTLRLVCSLSTAWVRSAVTFPLCSVTTITASVAAVRPPAVID